jgi:hypothetical protein
MTAKALMALLAQVMVYNCTKLSNQQWMEFLLLGRQITLPMHYAQGCDVEGTVLMSKQPFPVDVAVRKIPDVTRFKSTVTPDWEPHFLQKEIKITLRADSARLVKKDGSDLVDFSAVFHTTHGMDGSRKGNPTCDVHITQYKGKKVDVSQTVELH